MKLFERIFLYSVIAIMAFQLFLIDEKVESQVRVQEEIRAKRIVLVNDEGQRIVELWAYEEGGAISVYNKDGTYAAGMVASKTSGGRVDIYNKIGYPIATMATDEEGGIIKISNNIGNPIVGMMGTSKGHGIITVFNRDGKILGSLP